jgi:hypothetical protein
MRRRPLRGHRAVPARGPLPLLPLSQAFGDVRAHARPRPARGLPASRRGGAPARVRARRRDGEGLLLGCSSLGGTCRGARRRSASAPSTATLIRPQFHTRRLARAWDEFPDDGPPRYRNRATKPAALGRHSQGRQASGSEDLYRGTTAGGCERSILQRVVRRRQGRALRRPAPRSPAGPLPRPCVSSSRPAFGGGPRARISTIWTARARASSPLEPEPGRGARAEGSARASGEADDLVGDPAITGRAGSGRRSASTRPPAEEGERRSPRP